MQTATIEVELDFTKSSRQFRQMSKSFKLLASACEKAANQLKKPESRPCTHRTTKSK